MTHLETKTTPKLSPTGSAALHTKERASLRFKYEVAARAVRENPGGYDEFKEVYEGEI